MDFTRPGFPSLHTIMRTLERGDLPGQGPLQVWEDINKMNIDAHIYGWFVEGIVWKKLY